MSRYLKENKTAGSAALKRAQRNIYWQAGLALTTILLTVVIIFAMTAAWYTNIVQTSGLMFEAEAWGFDGEIVVNNESIKAAPGDEGVIHLEVTNSSDSISAVSVGANKNGMTEFPQMRQRLYFYVDTQLVRNGETMDRVYLNSQDSYTYTLFSKGKLTLTEETHSDAPLKWQWVYDMLGYYVLGTWSGGTFTEEEYLRPVEYDYDAATFDYVIREDGTIIMELKTVDGATTPLEFLKELSRTDGYEEDIDTDHPVGKGYYPVEVDENGRGVYVYLCSFAEIEKNTEYDTALGQAAASNPDTAMPTYPVSLTVSAQKNDENIVSVSTLTGINAAMELIPGTIVQLTENITLTGTEKILIPEGAQIILDLNGNKIVSQTSGNAVQADPGSAITLLNGEIVGSNRGTGIYSVGADVTMNAMKMEGFVDCVYVADYTKDNTMDSLVRLVECDLDALDCAIYVAGNGSVTEQKTQVIIEKSTLKSDNVVIYGNGDTSGTGRWGTDIQVIDSLVEANANKITTGIYHPQKNSNLTIYNSRVSGYSGIGIKGGNISVRASTIIGSGASLDRDPIAGNSGCDDTGDAIYIEANYGYEIRLEISGANVLDENGNMVFKTSVIDSDNNESLRVWEPDAPNVQVKIFSGKFKQSQPDHYIADGSIQLTDENALGYKVEIPETEE